MPPWVDLTAHLHQRRYWQYEHTHWYGRVVTPKGDSFINPSLALLVRPFTNVATLWKRRTAADPTIKAQKAPFKVLFISYHILSDALGFLWRHDYA